MAEFKDVCRKAKAICDRFEYCGRSCPLFFSKFCPVCTDESLDELEEIEKIIINYDLEGEE